tara:strand:- start:380 stop:730 length:351 start_codon:yes stop_codon:yes gene_type:complete
VKETVQEKYDRTKMWYQSAQVLLKNRTITDVWWQEWDRDYPEEGTGLCFQTDEGDTFFIGMDDEGNGPGALHIGMTDKRRKGFKKAGLCSHVLPVGVESNDSFIDLYNQVKGDKDG